MDITLNWTPLYATNTKKKKTWPSYKQVEVKMIIQNIVLCGNRNRQHNMELRM